MASNPGTPEAPDQSADQDARKQSPSQLNMENHPEDRVIQAESPQSSPSDKPAQETLGDESTDSENSSKASPVTPAGAADTTDESTADASSAPPLPSEPLPTAQDDGWDFHWDQANQAYFFYNRFTHESTWENPRVSVQTPASATENSQLQTPPATAVPPLNEHLPAGGYNPAIHGDYDPNAWYAKGTEESNEPEVSTVDTAAAYAAIGSFNRFTGRWQGADQNPERHNDESKSRRQMNAFFDVDAAANAHDGRSLKAERSGKKPSKSELKHFKEKRRARKEEKRRAWLRD
ncbi:hypothetical protein F5Y19DRAFT_195142 [Xylariaceae sp. FL1651]|nr:hypothetical protein F5Y19DRAFT_195142 [Xylariaceae sp. FL1651]